MERRILGEFFVHENKIKFYTLISLDNYFIIITIKSVDILNDVYNISRRILVFTRVKIREQINYEDDDKFS